jgi:hypothetical protein
MPETFNTEILPPHMRESVIGYLLHGWEPGNFLYAILTNDLVRAFATADTENTYNMFQWANWLYNYCPSAAWGSSDKVSDWIKSRKEHQ